MRDYTPIVIDHPHVGQIAETGCLCRTDKRWSMPTRASDRAGSVGGSYEVTIRVQWAFLIDAAARFARVPSHRGAVELGELTLVADIRRRRC